MLDPDSGNSLTRRVLRSKRVKFLHLENKKLGKQGKYSFKNSKFHSKIGINTLCKYLEWNKNIKTLNLSTNSINNEELQFLIEKLKYNTNIETLDLSMNRFDSLIIQDL